MKKIKFALVVTVLLTVIVICACTSTETTYKHRIYLPDSAIKLGDFEITSSSASTNGSSKYCILNTDKELFYNMLKSSDYYFAETTISNYPLTHKFYSFELSANNETIWFADYGDIWACQFYTDSIIHIVKTSNALFMNNHLVVPLNCGLFSCDYMPSEIDVPHKTPWSWTQIKQLVKSNLPVDEENKRITLDCWSTDTDGNFIEQNTPSKTYLIFDEANSTLTVSGDYFIEY